MAARYWCHMCSQMVNPIMEVEMKCPFCQSGFIEEMSSTAAATRDSRGDSDFGSDRALSLWAPILLGMMGNPRRRRRFRRLEFDDLVDDDAGGDHELEGGDTELDRELGWRRRMRRRRRSSAAILQLLHGIRAGLAQNSETRDDGERVILINPFSQMVTVQGHDDDDDEDDTQTPIGSLGDYFVGPGLDLLLQHLAEGDPNRYGSPPAQKEAIDALPTVSMKERVQCSVCLDDFEMGAEAKEMPCKHKFHGGCILPWLELHSSCPVCRFQLPADESKRDPDGFVREGGNSTHATHAAAGAEEEAGHGNAGARNGSGRRFSFPWPFNGLFSSSGSLSSGGSSSSASSTSASARAGNGSASQTDENLS